MYTNDGTRSNKAEKCFYACHILVPNVYCCFGFIKLFGPNK